MIENSYTPLEGQFDIEEAKRVLDNYDFTDELRSVSKSSGTRLFKIQNVIAAINGELSNAIDSLTEGELVDYLEERYKLWFLAHTEYKMCEINDNESESLKYNDNDKL